MSTHAWLRDKCPLKLWWLFVSGTLSGEIWTGTDSVGRQERKTDETIVITHCRPAFTLLIMFFSVDQQPSIVRRGFALSCMRVFYSL